MQYWWCSQKSKTMARRMYVCTSEQTHNAFNGPLSRTIRVSQYQEGKPIWILLKRDSEWQWYQLGHMQVCTSLQTDNHASIPPLSFLQAKCPSCCPTNSVKALKAQTNRITQKNVHSPIHWMSRGTKISCYHWQQHVEVACSTSHILHPQGPSHRRLSPLHSHKTYQVANISYEL